MFKDEALIKLTHPEYWNERYISEQKIIENGRQPILGSYESFRNLKTFVISLQNIFQLPPMDAIYCILVAEIA
jgi:hypothetical protein